MSNYLRVQRVRIQDLDEQGEEIGMPRYGVMAHDQYEEAFNDSFDTFAELEADIRTSGSILAVAGGDFDSDPTGFDNYFGPAEA